MFLKKNIRLSMIAAIFLIAGFAKLHAQNTAESTNRAYDSLLAFKAKTPRPAPPFELGLYTSDKKARLEDFKGKVILLTFWFPGCVPCKAEMQYFQNVVNKYDKKDLVYIGINIVPYQDDKVLPFLERTKYSFIPLRGTSEWAQKIYKVGAAPANFIIDKKGKIVYSGFIIDAGKEHMLELMINSLI